MALPFQLGTNSQGSFHSGFALDPGLEVGKREI